MGTRAKKAQAIRAAIEATKDKNGRLTPRGVVDAARKGGRNSLLYRQFGKLWDKDFAQQKALEDRARDLIVRYVTVEVTVSHKRVHAVGYVEDPRLPATEQGYISLTSDDLEREDAENVVLRELDRCRSAVRRATEVCAVLDDAHGFGLGERFVAMLRDIVEMETAVRSSPRRGRGADPNGPSPPPPV